MGDGYKPYSALTDDDRNALKGAIVQLAEESCQAERHTGSRMSSHGPSRRQLLRAATASFAVAARPAVALNASAEDNSSQNKIQEAQPFYGSNQSGITTPQQPYGILVAFDCLAEDKAGLERLFRLLTEHGARLTAGRP